MSKRRVAAPLRVTQRVDYALKSVILLAHSEDDYLSAKAVAEELGISLKLLGGVLWSLRAAGIVDSRAGWHGGFRLAGPADQIPLSAVIAAATAEGRAGDDEVGNPALGSAQDSSTDLVRRFWDALDRHVQHRLEVLTVADLAEARLWADFPEAPSVGPLGMASDTA